MSKNWKIITALLLAAAVGGVISVWRKEKAPEVSYRHVPVKRGKLEVTILATGTVAPENRLEIKPPVAGRIEQVLVKEGEKVHKGQILAWMSSTERAALLDAARAKGAAEVKRWEDLYRPTPVVAPLNGTIILRSVESGQTFTTSDAILVMSDRLTVKAQVDETDIAQIKLKQVARLVLDAYPKETIDAKVDQIAFDATTVNNVTNYIVDVLPDNTPDFMRSGMTANVTFISEEKDGVLTIPAEAVKREGTKNIVLVDENGTPTSREVELGATNGRKVEVVSGLSEGETVLVAKLNLDFGGSTGTNPFSPFRRKSGGKH